MTDAGAAAVPSREKETLVGLPSIDDLDPGIAPYWPERLVGSGVRGERVRIASHITSVLPCGAPRRGRIVRRTQEQGSEAMPREVVLPPVEAEPLELAWRLFPEHRERRGEPADRRGETER